MGGNMHLRYVVAVSSFAIGVPLASVHAQSTSPEPRNWSFSLGVDPGQLDLNTPEPGIDGRAVANLTRSWQSRNSKWARHISLMVGADAPHSIQPFLYSPDFASNCECWIRYASRYAALTVGASYDLLRVSRFTPYLTGGTGIYYTGLRRSAAGGVTPTEVPYFNQPFSQDNFAVGANAGVGLKMRFGPHEFFIEQMLHELDLNRRAGMAIAPLNIGFRF
jgi:hypothetical protein